jgi:hypothetical protein
MQSLKALEKCRDISIDTQGIIAKGPIGRKRISEHVLMNRF